METDSSLLWKPSCEAEVAVRSSSQSHKRSRTSRLSSPFLAITYFFAALHHCHGLDTHPAYVFSIAHQLPHYITISHFYFNFISPVIVSCLVTLPHARFDSSRLGNVENASTLIPRTLLRDHFLVSFYFGCYLLCRSLALEYLLWYKLHVLIHRNTKNPKSYHKYISSSSSSFSTGVTAFLRVAGKDSTSVHAQEQAFYDSLRRVARFFAAAFLPSTLFSNAWSSAPCCLCSSRI